jgi:polysaccharide chain length determinant protein (PEP-CTERM system associated)
VLPGKKLTPGDFVEILKRRKWAIIAPFVVIAFGTAVAAHFLPNKYRSETVVMVVPQRVPETYVRSTITAKIEDRLQAISQSIMSRTRLERIITDNNLYAEERRDGTMQDAVEQMRRDIRVDIIKGDAFRVSYDGKDPRVVRTVTERLASLTIDENLRDREQMAEGTNQFLQTQLDTARRQLVDQEKKLEDFRRRYSGELPSQAGANLQTVQNIQMQIQAVVESLNRDRDRKMVVQGMIADLNIPDAPTPVPAVAAQNGQGGPAGSSAQEQLANGRALLRNLEARLTPEHPDIIRMKRQIADLEQRAQAEALATPLSPEATPPVLVSPMQLARRNRLRELQLELESLDRQIAAKQTQEHDLRAAGATYQARIEIVPARETELAELTRDYDTLKKIYSDLLAKNEESKVAANLERRQIGEQFNVIDPARLPERPFSPDRPFINLVGALVGLSLGVGLAAFLEFRDASFRNEDEVVAVLALPVLARIPQIITAVEHKRLHQRRIALSVAIMVACLGGGAVVWRLGILNDLIR